MLPRAVELLALGLDAAPPDDRLLSPPHVAFWLSFARTLRPPALAAGFECRLASGAAATDFAFCIAREQARALLTEDASPEIRKSLSLWTTTEEGPWSSIPRAWIECDYPPLGSTTRSVWANAFPFFAIASAASPTHAARLLSDVIARIAPNVTHGYLSDVLAELPARARLLHLSSSNHRGEPELRIQASAGAEAVSRWLTSRPQYARPQDLLRSLLTDLPLSVLAVQTRTTITGTHPYSVEVTYPHGPHGDLFWRPLLERAVVAHLADPLKVESLLSWPGHSEHALRDAPASLRIDRTFHLSLRLNDRPFLKAYPYLCAQYVFH